MAVILRPDPALGTARNIFPRRPDGTLVQYGCDVPNARREWSYMVADMFKVGEALAQIRRSSYLTGRCLVRVYLK